MFLFLFSVSSCWTALSSVKPTSGWRCYIINLAHARQRSGVHVELANLYSSRLKNKKCYGPTTQHYRDVKRTLEKLVNRSPAARDLQAFLMFSQHPAWVCHAGKLIEKVFYCLIKASYVFPTFLTSIVCQILFGNFSE